MLQPDRIVFKIEILVLVMGNLYFAGRIVYSAIPYHGALSWKIDEWMHKKEVKLEHNNVFRDGAEGILEDLDTAFALPEELYLSNQFQITFDGEGTIKTIYTFLYGKNEEGETKTWLVDYNAGESEYMTVWVDGAADSTYEEDMRLQPMLNILEQAEYKQQVEIWDAVFQPAEFEILYLGRRSFSSASSLTYLPGDADGDGTDSGSDILSKLSSGGEIVGYEVSLHIPALEEVTPVRYIMEPEYISQETLKKEQEEQQTETSKAADAWTVDQTDGAMYFFLDDNTGWRLVVTDAAAGSRFYGMQKTENGGTTWTMINEDPFGGNIGVTEGLQFYDETFGFAALTGASWSYSRLFLTRDGGVTFTQLELPMDTVTELPELAAECGFTAEDYDYINMPEKEDDCLTLRVSTDAGEAEGIFFRSEDEGESWVYAGIYGANGVKEALPDNDSSLGRE